MDSDESYDALRATLRHGAVCCRRLPTVDLAASRRFYEHRISAGSLDEALAAVSADGGSVVSPPSADGPARVLATILDTSGNALGIVEHRDSRHRDSRHRDSRHRDSRHRDSRHRGDGHDGAAHSG
jgi:hypothetical protein